MHRRCQQCCQREALHEILTEVANALRDERIIDERESFIDATFAAAGSSFNEATLHVYR